MNNDDIDFNVIDDLIHFINNNTEFYKEVYYPLVRKIENNYKYNLPINKASFVPIVKRAYEVYKEVYDLDQLPASLKPEELSDVCNKLYQQETDKVKKDHSPDTPSSPLTDPVSEEIASLVKLAGVGSGQYKVFDFTDTYNKAAATSEYIKENNIQPGTTEWMKLWFPLDDSRFPVGFRGRKK